MWIHPDQLPFAHKQANDCLEVRCHEYTSTLMTRSTSKLITSSRTIIVTPAKYQLLLLNLAYLQVGD